MVYEANSTSLDEQSFMELVEIAIEALSGRRLALPPDSERCLEHHKGSPGKLTITFTGIPENQMAFSVLAECKERFGKKKGQKMFHGFMWRWWAILDAKKQGILTEFAREAGDMLEINTAVFRAAAQCPLNDKGKFEIEEYRSLIRQIISDEDATKAK